MVLRYRYAELTDRGLRANDPPRLARQQRRWVEAAGRSEYLSDSLIVRFRPGTSTALQQAMMALVDGTAGPVLSYADFQIVSLAGGDPEVVAQRLRAQPDVEYAQPRYRVRPMFAPNDPLYSLQWNYPQIGMDRAWDINRGASSNVIVAILDTGVAFRSAVLRYTGIAWQREDGTMFPALGPVDIPFAPAPDLGADRFVSPRDFIWDDQLPFDLAGHGTHVAGTVGQLTNNGAGGAGMAFNVRLMPVKVIDTEWDFIFDSPFVGTDDTVARGIRYAADNGAKVINMSIGRTGAPAPAVQSAVSYAVSHGAFVAVAGGNEFDSGNPPQRLAEFAPQIDGMVAVGATGPRWSARGLLDARQLHRAGGAGRRFRARRRSERHSPADPGSRSRGNVCRPGLALPGAAVRRLRLLLLRGHLDVHAARLRTRGTADGSGRHQPGRHRSDSEADGDRPRAGWTRRRVRLRAHQPARGAARHGAGQVSARGIVRPATWLAVLTCAATIAMAPSDALAQARPAPPRAAGAPPAVRVRGFFEAGARTFTASKSFEAVLGSSAGPIFGAGGEVLLGRNLFVSFGVSRFQRDGERVVVFEDEAFPVGIDTTVSIVPIELSAGWRFANPRRTRDSVSRRRHCLAQVSRDLRVRRPRARTPNSPRPGSSCSAGPSGAPDAGWASLVKPAG